MQLAHEILEACVLIEFAMLYAVWQAEAKA